MLAAKKRVVVIGAAGKKGTEYLQALLKRNDIEIPAVVINNNSSPLIEELKNQGTTVIQNGQVNDLIATVPFDIALVSVPHHEHHVITEALLQAGKYIIKEKPLAIAINHAAQYQSTIVNNKITPIYTTVQRDTLPAFVYAKEDLQLLGKPLKFQYDYWFNLPSVTTGWRSKMSTAFGGVILDMGYHAIDVITKFFGLDTPEIESNISYKYQETRDEQLEDYAEIYFNYPTQALSGKLILDRHAKQKRECFTIEGENGIMHINPQGYSIYDLNMQLIKQENYTLNKEDEIIAMFNRAIPYETNAELINQAFLRHMHNMEIIEQINLCKQDVTQTITASKVSPILSQGLFARKAPALSLSQEECSNTPINKL